MPRRLVGKLQRAYKKAGIASSDEKIRDFYYFLTEELHLDPLTKTSYGLSKIFHEWPK
jgi:hypothetical protein